LLLVAFDVAVAVVVVVVVAVVVVVISNQGSLASGIVTNSG
jgi:hypothetical protein